VQKNGRGSAHLSGITGPKNVRGGEDRNRCDHGKEPERKGNNERTNARIVGDILKKMGMGVLYFKRNFRKEKGRLTVGDGKEKQLKSPFCP